MSAATGSPEAAVTAVMIWAPPVTWGADPSVGFVHGMLHRAAGLLTEAHQRIRALITQVYAVCCDETPLRVGPNKPEQGKQKAERYLLWLAPRPTPTSLSATGPWRPSRRPWSPT